MLTVCKYSHYINYILNINHKNKKTNEREELIENKIGFYKNISKIPNASSPQENGHFVINIRELKQK